MVHRKSHIVHGVIERGENREFINDNFFTRSSPAPNIFESRSPANLSLGASSSFMYNHFLTPQSCTPTSDGYGMNNTFSKYQDRWNGLFHK